MHMNTSRLGTTIKTVLKLVAVISVIVIPVYGLFDILSNFKGFEYWFGVLIFFTVSIVSCFAIYMSYKESNEKRNTKNGYINKSRPGPIKPEELDFAQNVAKRLDEHRELVMDLIEQTDFLADREATPWRAGHLATQDDYLMYLFFLRYGMWPDAPNAVPARHCRPRPEILGTCGHPLYSR